MDLQWFISTFGYQAIVIGTFFEGETILIIAGFAAHRGYLSLPAVLTCGFIGTFIGDQLYFYIGRRRGLQFIEKRPRLGEKLARFRSLLDRFHTPVILAFRFLYGLRTVAPFAIGLSNISFRKFLLLNFASGVAWTLLVGCAGYFFGQTIEIIIEDVKRYEKLILAAGAAILTAHVLWVIIRNRRVERGAKNGGQGSPPPAGLS